MKVLRKILESEKTNLGKIELVKLLEDSIIEHKYYSSIQTSNNVFILSNILDEIKTKPTWGKNQLKDLFLDKILG
jgi:hypothetical protein